MSEEPYVFSGFLGLIISIYDTANNFNFNMIGLKKDFEEIYTEGFNTVTIPITRTQLKKVFIDYYNDPYKEMKSGYIKMKTVNELGKEVSINFNELTIRKQQQIKQFNNPIEIADATKYP